MEKRILVAAVSLACSCFSDPPGLSGGTQEGSEGSTSALSTTMPSSLSGSVTSSSPSSTTSTTSSTSDSSSEESSDASSSGVPVGDYALHFDGKQNGITPPLPGLPEEYTIEFEVQATGDVEFRGVMLSTTDEPVTGWYFYQEEGTWTAHDNVLVFIDYNAPSWNYLVDQTLDLNNVSGWHHVAVTKDNTGLLKFYFDGNHVAEQQLTTPFDVLASPLQVGAHRDGAYPLQGGALDNIRISSGLRYEDSFTPPTTYGVDAMALYLWRFDEGNGIVATDAVDGVELNLTDPMWMEREIG